MNKVNTRRIVLGEHSETVLKTSANLGQSQLFPLWDSGCMSEFLLHPTQFAKAKSGLILTEPDEKVILEAANGQIVRIFEHYKCIDGLSFNTEELPRTVDLIVCDIKQQAILGTPFFKKHNVKLIFGEQRPFAIIDSFLPDGRKEEILLPAFDQTQIPVTLNESLRILPNSGVQSTVSVNYGEKIDNSFQLIPLHCNENIDIEVNFKRNRVDILNLTRHNGLDNIIELKKGEVLFYAVDPNEAQVNLGDPTKRKCEENSENLRDVAQTFTSTTNLEDPAIISAVKSSPREETINLLNKKIKQLEAKPESFYNKNKASDLHTEEDVIRIGQFKQKKPPTDVQNVNNNSVKNTDCIKAEQEKYVSQVEKCGKKKFECNENSIKNDKCGHFNQNKHTETVETISSENKPKDPNLIEEANSNEEVIEGSQKFYENIPMDEKLIINNYVEPNKMEVFKKFQTLCNNGEPADKLQDDKIAITDSNEAQVWSNCFKLINLGCYYHEDETVKTRLQYIFWKNRAHFSTGRYDLGKVSPEFYVHSVKPLEHIPRSRICQPFQCSPQEKTIMKKYLKRFEKLGLMEKVATSPYSIQMFLVLKPSEECNKVFTHPDIMKKRNEIKTVTIKTNPTDCITTFTTIN